MREAAIDMRKLNSEISVVLYFGYFCSLCQVVPSRKGKEFPESTSKADRIFLPDGCLIHIDGAGGAKSLLDKQ